MARTTIPIRRTTKVSLRVLSHVFERPKEQITIRKALHALLKKHRIPNKKLKHQTVESKLGYLVEHYDKRPRDTPSYEEFEKMTHLDLSAYYEKQYIPI